MNFDVRYANHPDDSKHYDTQALRRHYHREGDLLALPLRLPRVVDDGQVLHGDAVGAHRQGVGPEGDVLPAKGIDLPGVVVPDDPRPVRPGTDQVQAGGADNRLAAVGPLRQADGIPRPGGVENRLEVVAGGNECGVRHKNSLLRSKFARMIPHPNGKYKNHTYDFQGNAMNQQISFSQYRTIDLSILAVVLAVSQSLITLASSLWFPDQLYVVSPVAGVVGLGMMRWGGWAAVHAVLGGILFTALSHGTAQHFIIYGVGNLLSMLALVLFKIFGKERIRKDALLTLAFALRVQVLMQMGRAGIALVLGTPPAACLGFITTDILICSAHSGSKPVEGREQY